MKWQETGPGGGGAVRDFAFDPQDPEKVYLTSDMVGVFVSDDGGDHWKWSSFGAANSKGGIAVDPGNSNILYTVGPDGIYQSIDRAKHWQLVYSKGNGFNGINNQTFRSLDSSIFGSPGQTIAINLEGTAYVSTIVGDIIISRDKGKNWKRVSTGGKSEVRAIIPIDENVVAAACYEDGLYLSNNNGTNWQKVLGHEEGKFMALAVHPSKRNILYTLVGNPSVFTYKPRYSAHNFPAYLYVSNDGGRTWELLHTFKELAIRKGRRLMDIGNDGTIIILGEKGPIRSEDEGKTWHQSKLQDENDDDYIYAIKKGKWEGNKWSIYADHRVHGRWYITGLGSALRSDDDGRTWQYKVKGLRQDAYFFVKVNPKKPDIVIASDADHGLIRSIDGGNNWQNIILINPYEECDELRFSPNDSAYKELYAFYNYPYPFIAKSKDSGETWTILTAWKNKGRGSMSRLSLMRGEDAPLIFVGEPGVGIWRSIDEGKSWEIKNKGLPKSEEISYIQFLESDNRGYIYAGIASKTEGKGGIFKSKDKGETWHNINKGLENLFVRRKSFEIDTKNPDILWVGAGRALYRSMDSGNIWEKRIDGGFFSAILVEPENSDIVYAASFTGGGFLEQYLAGIYKSVDGGNYFINISGDLLKTVGSSYRVYDLEYGWKGSGMIWAASSAGGLIHTETK